MSDVVPEYQPAPDFKPKVKTPQVKYVRSRVVPVVMIVAGMLFFIAVAADVRYRGKLAQMDSPIAAFFYPQSSYPLIFLSGAISRTGGSDVLVGAVLCFVPRLIRQKRWRMIAWLAFGLIGCAIINQGLKSWFAIPRPERYTLYVFKANQGLYTFPSGHTMSAALFSGLAVLAWMHLRPCSAGRRFLLGLLAGFWTTLVAASLLYLGVHYLTDLLAAFGLSLAWLGVLRLLLPPRAYDRPLPRP